MTRHIIPAVLALGLLGGTASAAAPPPPQEAPLVPAEVLAQAAGAVVGFGIYSFYFASEVAAAGGVVASAGGRLIALTLAGAGAVAGNFAYDYWTGQPLDYAYFWHRSGFIVGVAGGIAVFGVLGYPVDGGATWAGWVANRVTLIGAGMLGAWATDRWYRAEQ